MEPLMIVIILFIAIEIISFFYQRQLDKIWWLRMFLFIGIFIHELAHYVMCKLTLAPVTEFRVGLRAGHVTHGQSKIPILGSLLISLAPLIIGFVALVSATAWITHTGWLEFFNQFKSLLIMLDYQMFKLALWELVKGIDFFSWQFALYAFLTLNILATFVPSRQDFKNIAFLLVGYIIVSLLFPGQGQSFGMNFININLAFILAWLLVLLIIAYLFLTIIIAVKSLFRKEQ